MDEFRPSPRRTQLTNPNSLRWWEYGAYAQDQWTVYQKADAQTMAFAMRCIPLPIATTRACTSPIQLCLRSANVEIGGVGGNPETAGMDMGHGFYAPRLGVIYRLNEKTVIRSGAGLTVDPDSLRYLRDTYPMTWLVSYTRTAAGTIAVDPVQHNQLRHR